MLQPRIVAHLTEDDDPDLWELVTSTLLSEAEAWAIDARRDVYAQVGCCHHWISPHHPIRWGAGGGFAWPFGYDKTTTDYSYRAAPALEWSEFFRWTGDAWEPGRTGEKCLIFRIAIPARTARRVQAAVHTLWTPHSPRTKEKVIRLHGFRKRVEAWSRTVSETLRSRR